jgi:DNA-binding MarR family transcriptional regulator
MEAMSSPTRPTTAELTTTALSCQVRESVMRLTRRLRAERAETGYTLTQIAALATIERKGRISAGDLAAHERVRPPSMTRVIGRLEADGLVVTTAHPTDGRQKLIDISDAGRALLEADRRRRDAWLALRMEELSSEELDVLVRALPVLQHLAQA